MGTSRTNTRKSHTFENLTQGTTHTVTMRAIDNAGNTTDKTITIEVKRNRNSETGIEYDLNPTEATPEARLTLSTTTGHKIEYAIGTNNNENYREYAPIEESNSNSSNEENSTVEENGSNKQNSNVGTTENTNNEANQSEGIK